MDLVVSQTFESVLYEALNKSVSSQKLKISEEANFYVYQLLKEYLSSSKFKTVSGLSNSDKPLALMVKEALDAPTISEQTWRFVAIGDHSFFISSFFLGHVNRKFGDLNYCIGIGSSSYLQARDLYPRREKDLSKLYNELGIKFENLVKLATSALNSVREK